MARLDDALRHPRHQCDHAVRRLRPVRQDARLLARRRRTLGDLRRPLRVHALVRAAGDGEERVAALRARKPRHPLPSARVDVPPPAVPPRVTRLPRPVWLLGWVSFFTDMASEMIYPLLPLFLTRVLGAGALSLGIVEGIADAANSALKIVSGRLADKTGRPKRLVLAGYGLSSAVRPLMALASTWTHVLLVRFSDRLGKGIRGAPRDAMLAEF